MGKADKRRIFETARERIPERDCGIVGDFEPPAYNEMQRYCRDRGWMPIKHILEFVQHGSVMEIGPGPGYLGLEWLKNTQDTRLTGCEISEDMLEISRRNSKEYGLENRAVYIKGDVHNIPVSDGSFDAIISNDSFHEWVDPVKALNESYRVLKPGGKLIISDLRRDMNPLLKGLIWVMCRPKALRPGWLTSIDASYTLTDLENILSKSDIRSWKVSLKAMRFFIRGSKY